MIKLIVKPTQWLCISSNSSKPNLVNQKTEMKFIVTVLILNRFHFTGSTQLHGPCHQLLSSYTTIQSSPLLSITLIHLSLGFSLGFLSPSPSLCSRGTHLAIYSLPHSNYVKHKTIPKKYYIYYSVSINYYWNKSIKYLTRLPQSKENCDSCYKLSIPPFYVHCYFIVLY